MRVPSCEKAEVPRTKISDYLLSDTHVGGKHKAAFFRTYGFSAAAWEELANALKQHVAENEVTRTETTLFGVRYVIEAPLRTPDGRNPVVRSVWFVDNYRAVPRLVTAYPARQRRLGE